ncbi:THAP domain-containing protein 1-like [Dunckerocampus dactyliophorus]|uniref:THAP domain-containing protein 1-like n=1 Tax=Dunckerocampus dactyliophorus TaxID=161453 RepID=UPI0024068861|nr:THAP domain-containing protein 1-like [Dunckerocampus dactyliophorus]
MPPCAAINCRNRDTRENREKGLSFHRFPHCNAQLLKQWVVNMRRNGWIPAARSQLCSSHFTEENFDRTGQTVRLRQNAVPTVFDFPDHLLKNSARRKPPKVRTPVIQEPDVSPSCSTDPDPPVPEHHDTFKDHSYAITDSPRELKRLLDEAVGKLAGCKKKLKTEQQKARRLKRKVESLQGIVDTLQHEHIISTNCADILEGTFSGVTKEVLKRILGKKEGKGATAFPEELKAFAMTLQFYSEKAYNYVRETFDLALPHPRQLRKWYSKVDRDPGFTLHFDENAIEEPSANYGM